MKLIKYIFTILTLIVVIFSSSDAIAYPDAEVLGTGSANPPFDFGVSGTLSGFLLITDTRLVVSYGSSVKFIDVGSYALEAVEPPDLSADDGNDGVIAAIAHSSARNEIVASQEDGDVIVYNLADISATPASITVADGNKLGAIIYDTNGVNAYVADNTARKIHVLDMNTQKVTASISLTITGVASFLINDGVFVDAVDTAYFTTDSGTLIYVPTGATTAGYISLQSGEALISISSFPQGDYLYVADGTTSQVYKVATATNTKVGDPIELSGNADLSEIIIAQVLNPTATYAYVAGASGVSLINTSTDMVMLSGEPITTSAVPSFLQASSATDGYVYMGFATGKVGILSANPWITITSLTYSSGGSSLGKNETFTTVFNSQDTGTYEFRTDGGISADGNLLTDTLGATSGAVAASTDKSTTYGYDTNLSYFSEGANDLWIFVTSGSDRGRRKTTLTVDTPPPVVSVVGTGFGNGKIYVTVSRLDIADMATYRFYVATDEATALSMTTATVELAQATSGSEQIAEIGSLNNGTVYYAAVEAVDAAGNVSASRSVASETPSETVGPLGMMGENGCAMIKGSNVRFSNGKELAAILFIGIVTSLSLLGLRSRKRMVKALLVAVVLLTPSFAFAQQQASTIVESDVSARTPEKKSPQFWELELKTGFWLPKNEILKQEFTNCCNLISRIQGGLLYDKKYGVGIGAGFMYKSGNAVGTGSQSGKASGDRYKFMTFPLELNLTWRADYFSWRYLVPYIRTGFDSVIYRESVTGTAAKKGVKFGLHGGGGLQVNIGKFGDADQELDWNVGINDLFLTLEGVYQWINSFGGKGLDLSGFVFSAGLLMEF